MKITEYAHRFAAAGPHISEEQALELMRRESHSLFLKRGAIWIQGYGKQR